MKRLANISAAAAILMGLLSCVRIDDNDADNNPYRPLNLTTKSAEMARQGHAFSFDFLDRVNDATDTDFIISPLSMQFLLGMILDGAQGRTAHEICQVLGYGAGEVDAVNEYCLSMLQQLSQLDKKTQLTLANAIVVNKQYPLLESYKKTVGKFYEAEVSNLDFSDRTGTARKINNWCSKQTKGLVPKIIEPEDVSEDLLAILMNALYFKGQWVDPFPPDLTVDETFKDESDHSTKVKMMRKERYYDYTENDVFQAVSLPYGNGAFSLIALLPRNGYKVADITETLKTKDWNAFRQEMGSCLVNLQLPKFETKFHIEVSDLLAAMGMPSAFDAQDADFKAMSDYAMCLSFVQQDAAIKIDEKGSEAAAVSSAGMKATAFFPDNPVVPISFHADHTFLYLITESSTGAVLFAGRYSGK